jgi:hypothetical protein
MKNRRKRKQREEVRKILHTMRLELAAQRLAQEQTSHKGQILHFNEFLSRAQMIARS